MRFKPRRRAYRLFFATDVHGSDQCFNKFLAAARVYEADAIILGGDIIGKAIVPLVRQPDGYLVSFQGVSATYSGGALDEIKERIRHNGLYPLETDETDAARLKDDDVFGRQVFERIMVEQVERWCSRAEERCPTDVRCIITPGNDDPHVIDDVLRNAARVECPEGEVCEIGPAWLASLGNTNRTPWDTDREFDEPDLTAQIDAMLAPVADGRPLILNFHCPPYDSGLDRVAELDGELRAVVRHGQVRQVGAGSTAVRDGIVRYKPTVGLHGHIHESHGAIKIGSTWCLNPGSEYASGVLKGVIVDLDEDGRYHNHLLTSG